MKGVVLAGGTGSRLHPLTKVTNKHLLPVGTKPMIYHPLLKLREADVTEILVITGVEHMGDVVRLLGSGAELGMELTYRVQDQAGGIAEALGLARGFAAGGPLAVLLGDNVFEDSIVGFVDAFRKQNEGARLALKEVEDPQRFGVAELSANGRKIERIVEKPQRPTSPFAVTGIYAYDSQVFDIIQGLAPSARGELEITDVNNAYVEQGRCGFEILRGWWSDAGTFASWHRANALAFEADGATGS